MNYRYIDYVWKLYEAQIPPGKDGCLLGCRLGRASGKSFPERPENRWHRKRVATVSQDSRKTQAERASEFRKPLLRAGSQANSRIPRANEASDSGCVARVGAQTRNPVRRVTPEVGREQRPIRQRTEEETSNAERRMVASRPLTSDI